MSVNHVMAFCMLTVVGAVGWGREAWLTVGVSSLAAWLKLGQMLSPGRAPDLAELTASLVGVVLGCVLVRLWRRERRSN